MAKTAFPDLAKNISMTMTPMVFTARMMKQADPEARMCFIGPCAAKKLELPAAPSALMWTSC